MKTIMAAASPVSGTRRKGIKARSPVIGRRVNTCTPVTEYETLLPQLDSIANGARSKRIFTIPRPLAAVLATTKVVLGRSSGCTGDIAQLSPAYATNHSVWL
jgi:hypothetical protein